MLARVPVVTARPVAEAGLGTRLEDLARRSETIIALVLLLACSLPLVLLRRRAMRRRGRSMPSTGEHAAERRHRVT